MKKFLTSPVIREMQVETLVRDISYIFIYMVIKIKSLKISGIGQKMEWWEISCAHCAYKCLQPVLIKQCTFPINQEIIMNVHIYHDIN